MATTIHLNTNASAAHEILKTHDGAGNEVLHVFLGVALVSFVGVLLCSTIVANTLREMGDWAQRTARAEQQLSDPLEAVCVSDEYGDVFRDDDNGEQVRPVPLSAYRL